MVSTNLRRFWRSFRLSSMHLGANQVNDQSHSRVWLSFDSLLSLTHSQIDWFWMVCHWHCHCPGHGVSLTLQILGVETCPFIFALSKPQSWRTDVKDMQEWMTCRSGIARNHVLNRSWMALSPIRMLHCLGASIPRTAILGRVLQRMGIRNAATWDDLQVRALVNFWDLTACWPSPFLAFKLLGKKLEPWPF